jgi:predicted dehydrogenase
VSCAAGTKIRLGLLGAGRWGRNYIKTVTLSADAELTRVASSNPGTRTLVPASCAVGADWREVVAARDVDAVIVAAPASLHAEMASAALAAGKPVLLEKPAALSSVDARRLLDEAGRRGLHVLVEHTVLFHPAYAELKRRARDRGPVRAISSSGANRGPLRPDASALWDYGPHDVALCLDLLGAAPESADARLELELALPEGTARNYRLDLRFGGGICADVFIGSAAETKSRRFEVRCDGTTFVFDDLAADKLTQGGRPVPVSAELPLTRAVAAFVAAVRAGSSDLSSLELGARVVETLERCERALAARKRP